MTEQEVVELMKSCKTRGEWLAATILVKKRCDGYPSFWYTSVVQSGVMQEVLATWGDSGNIQLDIMRNIHRQDGVL